MKHPPMYINFLLVGILLAGGSNSYSQILPFKNYTTKDGLVSNNVRALYQDAKGYLWIGTIEGLNVYDGYSFRLYTTEDGLPSNGICCFHESRYTKGLMWIGTNNGVSRYYQGRFTSFRLGRTRLSGMVSVMLEDSNGVLWCGTGRGIFRIRNDSVETFIPDTSDFSAQSIVALDNNRIVFGCNMGLYLFDGKDSSFRNIDCDYVHTIEAEMYVTRENDSTVWVVANDSTLRKLVHLKVVQKWKLPCTLFSFLIPGDEDNLWVGTSAGLFEIQGRNDVQPRFIQYTTANGLLSDNISAGLLDRENNLWLTLFNEALVKLTNRYAYRFPFKRSQYLIMGEYRLVIDRNDHFWVFDEPNLVHEVWRDRFGAYRSVLSSVPLEYPGQAIKGGLLDSRGRLWIMYNDATLRCCEILSRQDSASKLGTISMFKHRLRHPSDIPFKFLLDRNNLLWYSFSEVGLCVFDLHHNKLLNRLASQNSSPYADAEFLYEDHKGDIWFAGGWGVGKIGGGFFGKQRLEVFNSRNGLASDKGQNILEDSRHRMWVSTLAGGVSVIQDSVVKTISMKDGLPSDWTAGMAEDSKGNIWIGTWAGLAVVDVQHGYNVTKVDALQGERIVSCKISTDGLVGVATDDALVIIDAEKIKLDVYPPPVRISEFNVDGKHVTHEERILEFPYTSTYFMIDYLGSSLTYENDMLYRYKLEGVDADWQKPTRERKIILAALGAGDYTFMVKAITPHGIESPQPAVLHFIIHPPFWQRWWFIATLSIIFAGGVYTYTQYRVSKAENQHRAQQEFSRRLIDSQEQERKRIAAELHDGIAQNLLIIKNRAALGIESCPKDAPSAKELEIISSVSSETIENVREISYNLRPYQFDRLGLTKSIQSIISRMEGTIKIPIALEIVPIDDCLTKDAGMSLYRIIQEGLNNTMKHAKASHVHLKVEKTNSNILVRLQDDGTGFNSDEVTSRSGSQQGFGLRGIAERVKNLNGTLSIISSPGQGTKLTISIPCQKVHNG